MKRNKRVRIDTTVDKSTDWWLREKSRETGLPVGRLLDNLTLNQMLKERNAGASKAGEAERQPTNS